MGVKYELIDLKRENKIPALWRQAFRPFFLAGTVFSALALALWAAVLSGHLTFIPYGNIIFWHAHEMLFGFVTAIIAGFLLTAVQSWTGLRATHGKSLIVLFVLWLTARVLIATGLAINKWIIVVIDISFLLTVAFFLAQLVIKARSHRNLLFIPVLGLLAFTNLLTHLSVVYGKPALFTWGMHAAIILTSLLMVVIGGRVIPLFTAGGTKTQPIKPLPWLEKTVVMSTWFIVLLYITNSVSLLADYWLVAVFTIAALSNAYRAFRWRIWVSFSNPLVWPLHLAYWFIPLGFALFAIHYAGVDIRPTTALHSLTAGAMGSLILAMIARISLGHSGRPLAVHNSVKYAFIFILMAGVTRLITDLYPAVFAYNGYTLTVLFWILAYGIYFAKYFRILTTPRADGKPG